MKNAPLRPELELGTTGLRVFGGELQRCHYGKDDSESIVMRVPLKEVEAVQLLPRVVPASVFRLLLATGFAGVAYQVSEYNILTVLLYVAALIMALTAVNNVFGQRIAIQTATDTINIPSADERDEAHGFVLSVRRLIGQQPEAEETPPRRQRSGA